MGLRQRPSPSQAVRLGVMAATAPFAFAIAALRALVFRLASASRMFCAVPCYDLVRQPRLGRPLVEAIKHLTARQAQRRHAVDRAARGGAMQASENDALHCGGSAGAAPAED